MEMIIVISDVEIFVDFNDSNVIFFLFKELKKYSILHFKEFIQKDSIIYEKNEHYANEVIISYDVGSHNSKDNCTKLYPIVENAHEAIITQEIFDRVQKEKTNRSLHNIKEKKSE